MQNESFFELLKPDIERFLYECARRTNEGNLKLIPRDKNMASIYEMGLSILNVEEIVSELRVEDYYRGPTSDHKFPIDDVWEFISFYETYKIYIKLKLDAGDLVVCLSFHEAER